MGNQTWGHQGVKKQLCKDRLLKKSVVFKGWPENGKSGAGATRGPRSNCVRTSFLKSVAFKGWPESGESEPGGTRGLRSNCLMTGSLKKCCFERVARTWEIRTWSHRGAKKQLCKDRLSKRSVVF